MGKIGQGSLEEVACELGIKENIKLCHKERPWSGRGHFIEWRRHDKSLEKSFVLGLG